MKKSILFLLGLSASLCACTSDNDPLIGTWTVEKVNVQFDEHRGTPELVKQVGEMEKQNRIVISTDSILTFKNMDGESQGRLHLSSDGTMTCNGIVFGQWKAGEIVTRAESPLGEISVKYKKE